MNFVASMKELRKYFIYFKNHFNDLSTGYLTSYPDTLHTQTNTYWWVLYEETGSSQCSRHSYTVPIYFLSLEG